MVAKWQFRRYKTRGTPNIKGCWTNLGSPLDEIETAIMFKGFGWFTKEALEKNKEIWVDNIVGIAKGTPHNPIEL